MSRQSYWKCLSRRQFTLLASALLIPWVLEAKVKIFASKKKNVTAYETYQWLPPRIMARFGLLQDDDQLMTVIRQSVTRELSRKGYREVAEGGDLKVATGGFSITGSHIEGFLLQWGWDYYWGPLVMDAAPVSRVDREGTLLIALIDTQTDEGVWGGLTTALIGRPETVGKTITKAAKDILKKLPKRRK